MTVMTETEHRTWASAEEVEKVLSRGSVFFTPARVAAGIRLAIDLDVPPPLVTSADLARMKRLNHCLIWLPEQTSDGAPITMKAIHDAGENKCHQGGKFLYRVDWYANESFYLEDTPRGDWREVSFQPLPQSFGKTFCEQLCVLVDYLKTEIWPEALPSDAAAAIAEFEAMKRELTKLEKSNWQEAARREAALQISRYLPTPVEQAVLMLVHQKTNGERPLGDHYARNARLSSCGRLVDLGVFDSGGADVSDWDPRDAFGGVGVLFSRTLKN